MYCKTNSVGFCFIFFIGQNFIPGTSWFADLTLSHASTQDSHSSGTITDLYSEEHKTNEKNLFSNRVSSRPFRRGHGERGAKGIFYPGLGLSHRAF